MLYLAYLVHCAYIIIYSTPRHWNFCNKTVNNIADIICKRFQLI